MKFKYVRTEDDMAILDDIDETIFPYDGAADKEFLNQVWHLVLNEVNEVIGFCGLKYYPEYDYGFLARSGILPKYRGQGFQKKAIKLREKWLKKLGLGKAITYTSNDNFSSANNLISCGYKLYEPATDYGIEDALYFIKELK